MAMIGRQFLMDHKSQPPLYSFNTSVSDHVRLVSTCEKVSGYQKCSEILCSENQTKTIGSRIQLATESVAYNPCDKIWGLRHHNVCERSNWLVLPLLLVVLTMQFSLDRISGSHQKKLKTFCFLLIRIKLLWGGKIWLNYRQRQLQVILQNAFYYPHSPLSDPEPTDESFACKNCGKMYSNPASLIGHLKYKCNTGVIITSWLLHIQYVFNYFL